jgi:hypothetical protein
MAAETIAAEHVDISSKMVSAKPHGGIEHCPGLSSCACRVCGISTLS